MYVRDKTLPEACPFPPERGPLEGASAGPSYVANYNALSGVLRSHLPSGSLSPFRARLQISISTNKTRSAEKVGMTNFADKLMLSCTKGSKTQDSSGDSVEMHFKRNGNLEDVMLE